MATDQTVPEIDWNAPRVPLAGLSESPGCLLFPNSSGYARARVPIASACVTLAIIDHFFKAALVVMIFSFHFLSLTHT